MKEVKGKQANNVDKLFKEVQEEVNEDVIKDAKIQIKTLLLQKAKAVKVTANIERQIDDLKLKIASELT